MANAGRNALRSTRARRLTRDVPVRVDLVFLLPKPPSRPKRRRCWPTVKPDIDKLVRAVLDALTSVVFTDDAQVVALRVDKDYGATWTGVDVRVREVTE